MNLMFAPLPGRYAVIRIDPLGTVEQYEFPDIHAAAQKIPTQKYLVFLMMNLNLPIPDRPWHAFGIVPIPKSLPPVDDKRAATPDMCTPISPNASHPGGREPLITDGVFPYNNCYHWSDDRLTMDVRVRARPEEFDDDIAIKLTVDSEMKLQQYMGQDFARMQQTRAERRSKTQPQGERAQEHRVEAERDDSMSETDAASSIATSHDMNSDGGSVTLGEVIQDVLSAGIFGNFGEDQEIYPLVDLWFDLAANLNQEDIPDPKELFKERDAVVELIMEGRRRQKEEAAKRVREQEAAGDVVYVAKPETRPEPERNAKRRSQ